jgi:signal transduction histidine kinase/ActR/RegA family two-component response regulator
MFSFVSRVASPAACLGPVAAPGRLESSLDPASPADPAVWLQARMLWLICALASAFACLYSAYFISVGLSLAAPVGPLCVTVSAVALRFARSTGRYQRALDIVSVLLFAMLALTTLFQDGVRSPALWWLAVPAITVLLAGRLVLGAALCVLFAAQVLLLYLHGPGSMGSVSLLAADRSFQLLLSMTLSALFVGVCAALSSHWGLQLRRALDRARAAALSMSAAKARFVSHVSHEIRTPLQGMIGATEMLREPALAAERRLRLVDIQRQSAAMLLAFVSDVLDFSKLEAGKVVLESRSLSLAAMIDDVLAYFGPQACEKGIELSSSRSPDVPETMLGDGTRIRQVLTNLVSNAIKFTTEGSVHVHLGLDGRAARDAAAANGEMRVRIQVADSGVGIAAERLSFLFKPFQQADESITRRFGGTGLGLSIADDLAHLMRGRIDVTSAVGRGSTFTLVVPLALPEVPAGVASRRARLPSAPPGDAGTALPDGAVIDGGREAADREGRGIAGRVIVVAEDDPANQVVVVAMLEALHAKVVVASNGREALAAIDAATVDAVLMDVHMPDFDGLNAIRALRQRERFEAKAPLPVVAMTGSTEPAEIAACFAAGMNMILTKPFQLAELRRTLFEATNPPSAMPAR